jgi:predicted DNA binding CopG/RHH family protein
MEFRNEQLANLSENNTLLQRDLGNVNEDSEITFEYRMKDAKVLAEMQDIDILALKEIPF